MGVELAPLQHRPQLPLDGATAFAGSHVAGHVPGAVEDLHRLVTVGVGVLYRSKGDLERRPDVVPVEIDAPDAAWVLGTGTGPGFGLPRPGTAAGHGLNVQSAAWNTGTSAAVG